MLIGFFMVFYMAGWLAISVMLLGLLLCIDDAYQHMRQKTEPNYTSIIHRLYGATLWKLEWVRRLNAWADNWFGR
jgi:hypothetical protein